MRFNIFYGAGGVLLFIAGLMVDGDSRQSMIVGAIAVGLLLAGKAWNMIVDRIVADWEDSVRRETERRLSESQRAFMRPTTGGKQGCNRNTQDQILHRRADLKLG